MLPSLGWSNIQISALTIYISMELNRDGFVWVNWQDAWSQHGIVFVHENHGRKTERVHQVNFSWYSSAWIYMYRSLHGDNEQLSANHLWRHPKVNRAKYTEKQWRSLSDLLLFTRSSSFLSGWPGYLIFFCFFTCYKMTSDNTAFWCFYSTA